MRINISLLCIVLAITMNAQSHTLDWGNITVLNNTSQQTFSNIDGSGINMTLKLSHVMNEVTQPVQPPFVPYIGDGDILRIWKTTNPSVVTVTLSFSEAIDLDEFGFGGLRCYGSNCDNGKFTWYDGPSGTGNQVTPSFPMSYDNINYDTSDPLDPSKTITELDGSVSGGSTGDGTVTMSGGTYDVNGSTITCNNDCGKVYYIFNYHSAKVRSLVWTATRNPSGTPSQYLGGINFTKASTVPLDLLTFQGKNLGQSENLLTWSTQSEINVSHFEVQKYSRGRYNTIARLQAKNQNQQKYDAVDDQIENNSRYRLLMVDLDGHVSISNEIVVYARKTTQLNINVYPNPVSDELQIDFGNTYGYGKIEIRNQIGQVVKHISFDNEQLIKVKISDLSSGIYFLTCSMLDRQSTHIVSVQK